jgi:MerR family transcriptional regulator/heat shock protein HspR
VQEIPTRFAEGVWGVAGAEQDRARGLYGISVAAELVGTGIQNLRAYEARGLLEPQRTEGGTRRYSDDDLDRLRRIGDLLDAGLNLAGIAMVMDLQDENSRLRGQTEQRPSSRAAPRTSVRSSKGKTRKAAQTRRPEEGGLQA